VASSLELEAALRQIAEAAVTLVNARYGALGVIGEGGRLAEFSPVGLNEEEIARIDHWPEGRGAAVEVMPRERTARQQRLRAAGRRHHDRDPAGPGQ
jgi:hypothetical protein